MLNIEPTNDKTLLDTLSLAIFGKEYDGAVGFVLYVAGKSAGLAKLNIKEDVSVIECVGIVPSERKKGYGDFLTRSLMNNLSYVSKKIKIAYCDAYFEKFGFRQRGGSMVTESKNIVFPSKCIHQRGEINGDQ